MSKSNLEGFEVDERDAAASSVVYIPVIANWYPSSYGLTRRGPGLKGLHVYTIYIYV